MLVSCDIRIVLSEKATPLGVCTQHYGTPTHTHMCASLVVCSFQFHSNNLVRLIRTRMRSEAHTMSPATFRSNIMICLEVLVAHQRYRRHQSLERLIERSHIYLLLSIIGRFQIIIIIHFHGKCLFDVLL